MNLHNLSNEDLVERIQQADSDAERGEAWEELFARVNRLIHQMTGRALRSARAASPHCEYDDLFQVAQTRAFECAKRFDGSRGVKFTTYLYESVQGALLKYVAAQGRQSVQTELIHEPTDEPAAPNPVDIVLARETVSRLMDAMKLLNRDAQMVCELRFFDDLPIDEIAETLKMNRETVKSHIHRSRAFLRQALKDEEVA